MHRDPKPACSVARPAKSEGTCSRERASDRCLGHAKFTPQSRACPEGKCPEFTGVSESMGREGCTPKPSGSHRTKRCRFAGAVYGSSPTLLLPSRPAADRPSPPSRGSAARREERKGQHVPSLWRSSGAAAALVAQGMEGGRTLTSPPPRRPVLSPGAPRGHPPGSGTMNFPHPALSSLYPGWSPSAPSAESLDARAKCCSCCSGYLRGSSSHCSEGGKRRQPKDWSARHVSQL